MDIHKLMNLCGKEYRDKKLVDFFKENGFDVVKSVQKWMQTTTYKGMESSTYAINKEKGYSLHFDDELAYFNAKDGRYGESGRYYLTAIFFYSDGADGYHQYEGELVNGIRITDTREEIRALMAKPYKGHNFLDKDKWEDVNGCIVSVDYKGDETPFNICIYMDRITMDVKEALFKISKQYKKAKANAYISKHEQNIEDFFSTDIELQKKGLKGIQQLLNIRLWDEVFGLSNMNPNYPNYYQDIFIEDFNNFDEWYAFLEKLVREAEAYQEKKLKS